MARTQLLHYDLQSKQNYALDILQSLYDQQQQGEFCDIVIKVNDGIEFKAHKSMLAAASVYFKAMFSDGMVETYLNTITLQDTDPRVFKILLDFIYTGEIKLTEENWQDIFQAANMFQLGSAVNICCDFVKDKLHPSNCLGFYELASRRNCCELAKFTQDYIFQHFLDIVTEDEFLNISIESLCDLLSSENIHIDEEHETLKAAVKWLEHDMPHRKKYLRRLANNIRFPFITPTALHNIIEDCSNDLKLELKLVTSQLSEMQVESGERTVCQSPTYVQTELLSWWCYPRLAARRNIFLVGGYAQKDGQTWNVANTSLNECECFSTYLKQWQSVSPMHISRSWHGTCRLNGLIYVAGGESESLIFSSVEYYNPQTSRWTLVQDMIMPRCGFGLAALAGKLYAFGGWVGSELGLSVESYDPKEDQWQIVDSMATPRNGMGIATYGDEIFLVGGMTDMGRELKSMESYNPINQQWNHYSDMSRERSHMGVAVVDDSLFVVGGWIDDRGLDTVEKWSFTERKWINLRPLPRPRAEASLVAASGVLYVIGGREIQNGPTLDSMECFDIKSNTWTRAPQFGIGRTLSGAVVL